MSLMEQGVHKYGMVVTYFQCRSSIYIWSVCDLDQKYDKLLYSDQQGLTKLKTNKQVLCRLIILEIIYLALVGIFHH